MLGVPFTTRITLSAVVGEIPPRTPVVSGVPKSEARVSQFRIRYVSPFSPVRMPSVVRSATVESAAEIVAVVAVFWVVGVVEIRNMCPCAAPLVIKRSFGSEAFDSSPGVQSAEKSEKVVAVTLEKVPNDLPVSTAVSSRGRDMSDVFLTEPVPAGMEILTMPEGMVAASWAGKALSGRVRANPIAAQRGRFFMWRSNM